jgi:hypothetical protein
MVSTSLVHAEPLPHAVSCTLFIGDAPVQDNLLVEAKIDGVLYAATYTKDGRFGYDPYFKIPADTPYTEEVEGGRDGDAVQIYLDGEEILEFTFESGRISNFVEDISRLFNDPPVASTQTSLNGVIGYSVELDATGSYDPNTANLTYIWHHDFGAVSTGKITSVTYQMAGEYTTTLTVADPQGLEDSMNVEATILPQPAPTGWTQNNIEGGKQGTVSLGEAASIWVTSLDSMTVSLLEFNRVFLDNRLPQINSGGSFAIICDHSKLVYPVYFEAAIPEALSSYDELRLYSWHAGGWQPVHDSGKITGADRVWAYLDENSLSEGIYTVGYELGTSSPRVENLRIKKEGEKYRILAHFEYIDRSSRAYLRIDDRLVATKNILENEVVFESRNLKPGIQVFKVNGLVEETMIHSDENVYLLFSLSALPVALTTFVFKKYN